MSDQPDENSTSKSTPPKSGPPPLPSRKPTKPTTRLIRRIAFKESVSFSVATFDYRLIEKTHDQAEQWINGNPEAEIVQIQTFHSSTHGVTVVWYR